MLRTQLLAFIIHLRSSPAKCRCIMDAGVKVQRLGGVSTPLNCQGPFQPGLPAPLNCQNLPLVSSCQRADGILLSSEESLKGAALFLGFLEKEDETVHPNPGGRTPAHPRAAFQAREAGRFSAGAAQKVPEERLYSKDAAACLACNHDRQLMNGR